jgi:hypothetical protein
MSQGKLRKQFTNSEIKSAITEAGGSYTFAAKKLSELRGLTISRELVRYWARHLDTRRANGEPYIGTSVLDRQIRDEMELRVPSPADDQKLYATSPDNSRILNIPDQHAPYQHPDALWFLADVAAKLRPTRVINLGDETDGHAMSFHDSDPNLDSAGVELEKAKEFIQALAKMFPVQDVCHSNHGSLIYRRALKHGIPTQYIKTYRDILFPDGGGEGWGWHERIPVILPNGDKLIYQHQSSGDILNNAAHERANIVQGHEHGDFYIRYRSSTSALYWAMVSGCLIDRKAYAFAYGRLFPKKPIIGCSAIIDSHPLLIPMPMDDHGRYTGKLNGALTL